MKNQIGGFHGCYIACAGLPRYKHASSLKTRRILGWWFGTCFFLCFIHWDFYHPNWLIFFRGIETINQIPVKLKTCFLIFQFSNAHPWGIADCIYYFTRSIFTYIKTSLTHYTYQISIIYIYRYIYIYIYIDNMHIKYIYIHNMYNVYIHI